MQVEVIMFGYNISKTGWITTGLDGTTCGDTKAASNRMWAVDHFVHAPSQGG